MPSLRAPRRAPVKEADLQRLILDWLQAKGIWAERRNTGAVTASYRGRSRFIRYGRPGVADIMAVAKIYRSGPITSFPINVVYWIEVKAPKGGRQTPEQKRFQLEVESAGMTYILARSLEDVINAIER